MARVNLRSKRLWKRVLSTILAIGLALGSVIGITALVGKIAEDDLKTVHPKFQVGLLDESGLYKESKTAIYSDEFECQGLLITPKFESSVSYKVFYYDVDKKFIGNTKMIDDVYSFSKDEGFKNFENIKYARVLIYPKDDATIYWYEVYKYKNDLKIEVNKNQETTTIETNSLEDTNTVNDTTSNN